MEMNMITIEDQRGEIIDTLWDVLDYIRHGPVDPDALEARVQDLIDSLTEDF